jgi:hypothetical protein
MSSSLSDYFWRKCMQYKLYYESGLNRTIPIVWLLIKIKLMWMQNYYKQMYHTTLYMNLNTKLIKTTSKSLYNNIKIVIYC